MKSIATILLLITANAFAQHEHHQQPSNPATQQPSISDFLMRQASGTATNPAAAPMHMAMTEESGWMLMLHGNAFVSGIVQTGPRGDDALTSTNWIMGMASRRLGPGHLMLRTMLSLEPAIMGQRGYPLLFQTGETAHGVPLVDRQHPHDFFMELAAEYAINLDDRTILYFDGAPVGDPALGPVAFPHRASAAEIPQAPLSHHVQDSTHIASSVMTIGAKRGAWDLALSGFHGQEPDENRWNIDRGGIDSWAVRAQWNISPNLAAQISTGHLENPERSEPGDVQRTTASLSHSNGAWSGSIILGRNDKSHHADNSVLLESNFRFNASNYITGRFEIADKEETVKALTLGYTKDLFRSTLFLGGVGGNVTFYDADGQRPRSYYAFARVRLGT